MQRDGTSDARFRKNSSKQVRERLGSVRANSGLIVDWTRRRVQGESRGLRGGGPKPSPPRYKPFQSTPESLCVWPATSTPVRQSIGCGQFACQQAYHRISANCRGRESDSHWCMMLGGAQALSVGPRASPREDSTAHIGPLWRQRPRTAVGRPCHRTSDRTSLLKHETRCCAPAYETDIRLFGHPRKDTS